MQEQGTALTRLDDTALDYARKSRAESTRRCYQRDWEDFVGWCEQEGHTPLPAAPETVAIYLAARAADLKVSTLQRRVAAISVAHQTAGHSPPTRDAAVRAVMAGIRRERGTVPAQKAPVRTAMLKSMLPAGDRLIDIRDRALLLLGFATALRRSELVALDVADLNFADEGLTVTLRRSKTDQEGLGRKIGVPCGSSRVTCPVRAVKAWLDAYGMVEGPLFRSVDRHGNLRASRLGNQAVARVVQRRAAAAGMDPAALAGHSLRSGFVTQAAVNGAPLWQIARTTGHRSLAVLDGYVRDLDVLRDSAASSLGL